VDQRLHGKTSLSIELAKKINGEIISADSMQIYKYMDIGSAKPTKEEMDGIKHYMIDFVEPDRRYSVAEYKKDAINCIKEVLGERKNTNRCSEEHGLYVNSLIYGIEYNEVEYNQEYRKSLEKIAETDLEKLYNEALKIDPKAMEKISRNDKKRIIRVLEIYKETGKTKTEVEIESRKNGVEFDYKVFVLNLDREKLYEKINRRVDQMLDQGLIEEVKEILEKYKTYPTAMQAIGYKETKNYLEGNISKEEMIEKIKMETRRYAKRQLTWFRKNKEAVWLNVEDGNEENVRKIMEE